MKARVLFLSVGPLVNVTERIFITFNSVQPASNITYQSY